MIDTFQVFVTSFFSQDYEVLAQVLSLIRINYTYNGHSWMIRVIPPMQI